MMTMNGPCEGLLSLAQSIAPNCSATIRLAPALPAVSQYDVSNDDKVCNNGSSVRLDVAATVEPYLHASDREGVCSGIISSTYVPAGSDIDPTLAPMLPPYAAQSIIEAALQEKTKALPVWMAADCRFALLEVLCSSAFLRPQITTIGAVLVSNGIPAAVVGPLASYSFSLPSYPARAVCEKYHETCGSFISLVGVPGLDLNCSALVSGGSTHRFPIANQSVASATLYGVPLALTTAPNTLYEITLADIEYEPICPPGFLVPDRNSLKNGKDSITMVAGTGCAAACRYSRSVMLFVYRTLY
jgi:hypothetical protein